MGVFRAASKTSLSTSIREANLEGPQNIAGFFFSSTG
jgi:hypothetical protein